VSHLGFHHFLACNNCKKIFHKYLAGGDGNWVQCPKCNRKGKIEFGNKIAEFELIDRHTTKEVVAEQLEIARQLGGLEQYNANRYHFKKKRLSKDELFLQKSKSGKKYIPVPGNSKPELLDMVLQGLNSKQIEELKGWDNRRVSEILQKWRKLGFLSKIGAGPKNSRIYGKGDNFYKFELKESKDGDYELLLKNVVITSSREQTPAGGGNSSGTAREQVITSEVRPHGTHIKIAFSSPPSKTPPWRAAIPASGTGRDYAYHLGKHLATWPGWDGMERFGPVNHSIMLLPGSAKIAASDTDTHEAEQMATAHQIAQVLAVSYGYEVAEVVRVRPTEWGYPADPVILKALELHGINRKVETYIRDDGSHFDFIIDRSQGRLYGAEGFDEAEVNDLTAINTIQHSYATGPMALEKTESLEQLATQYFTFKLAELEASKRPGGPADTPEGYG